MFMWGLFGGNYENADYSNYYYAYDLVKSESFFSLTDLKFESGFLFLMKFLSFVGLDYNQFLMVLSFLGLGLIVISVERETPKPEFVYLLYLLYPFFFDVVQIRFFCACAIFCFSLHYLSKPKYRNKVKYAVGVIIASLFHITALPFLVFIFLDKTKPKRILIASILVSGAGFLLVWSGVLPFLLGLLNDRLTGYISNPSKIGFIFYITTQLGLILLVLSARTILIKRNIISKYVEMVYKLNIASIAFFPLYIVNSNFIRLYRVIIIPTYIVLSLLILNKKPQSRMFFLLKAFLIVGLVGLVLVWLLHGHSVLGPIMGKNRFLEAFSGLF